MSAVSVTVVTGQVTSVSREFPSEAEAIAFLDLLEAYEAKRPRKYEERVYDPYNPCNRTISYEYQRWLENHPDPQFAGVVWNLTRTPEPQLPDWREE